MSTPISPSMQPHGYYSQLNAGDQGLPPHIEDHIKSFKDQLDHISNSAQQFSKSSHQSDIEDIAQNLKRFDHELSQFFSELNNNPNRGFESQVKMQFEVAHHAFEDKIKDITDADGKSMREALYDKPGKFIQYLQQLNKGDIDKIGQHAKEFSEDLTKYFKLS